MESGNKIQDPEIVDTPPHIKKRSGWAAFFFTLACPGLGHLYAGEIRKGFVLFLISFIIVIIESVLLKFIPSLIIIGLCFLISLPFSIYIFVDVVTLARNKKNYILKNYNKRFFYVLIILTNMFYLGPIEKIFQPNAFITPTGSMMNTILIGDMFLTNNLAYGIHNPLTEKYVYVYNKPLRGDIVEFFSQNLKNITNQKKYNFVKRILAIPGDTLAIRYRLIYINNELYELPNTANLNIFEPNLTEPDSKIFPKGSGWNQDNYGPLIIPKAGKTVYLDSSNIHLWRQVIEDEGNKVEVTWSKIIINDKENYEYTFRRDYYFMIGDNWYNSLDSRYFGFVAEDDIISKITMIYFSRNPDIPFSRFDNLAGSVRWDRIGKQINQ